MKAAVLRDGRLMIDDVSEPQPGEGEHRVHHAAGMAPGLSAREAVDTGDGWTLAGPAGSVTAQYEHTLVVGRHGPIVVTDLGWVH